MKWLVVALLAAVALTAQADFTEEQKAKLTEYFNTCTEETGADKDAIRNARKNGLVEEPKIMAYYHCMMKKMGFQDEDGTVHADVMISKLPAGADKTKGADLVHKCTEGHAHHSKEKTAFEIYKCFRDNVGDQASYFAFN